MIVDDLSQIKNKNFFAIIIGSGPAGLTTALELEKKKIFSIIIEAGSKEYDSNNLKFLLALNSLKPILNIDESNPYITISRILLNSISSGVT